MDHASKMSHTSTTTATHSNGQAVAASSSMEDTLDRMIDNSFGVSSSAAASLPMEKRPEFIPSKTWQGSKDGYYFGTSKQKGTGYFKDPTTAAATADGDSPIVEEKNNRKRKGVRIDEKQNKVRIMTGDELLKQAEEATQDQKVMELTPRGVQQATLALQRALDRNAMERAKHAESPELYMESELALHGQITMFKAVAANPELYPLLQTVTEESFPTLLSHENSDVALSVMNVLVDWLDPETMKDAEEDARDGFSQIAASVVDNCLELIVSNLGRLGNEDDEDIAGVEDTLTLVESLLELDVLLGGVLKDSSVTAKLLKQTYFFSWLLPQATDASARVQSRAAELLSFLLQQEDGASSIPDVGELPPYQSEFAEGKQDSKSIDGMELLLQAIALYRKRHPSNETECDILENQCLALASLLFQPKNVHRFLEGQGIELVLRCLKEKVHAGGAALKTLDFCGSDPVYVKACEHLVDAGGLKYLFPIFMGRSIPKPAPCTDAGRSNKNSKRTQHARREWLQSLEENAIRILYSLIRHIKESSPHDAHERLLVKFLEEDCEKCDRLVELALKYDERARASVYSFYRSDVEEEMDSTEVEFAALSAKLKGGGDLFHRVGAITAFCCVGSKRGHEHTLEQLTLQKSGIGVIKDALEEFSSVLEDGDQKTQLQRYLSLI